MHLSGKTVVVLGGLGEIGIEICQCLLLKSIAIGVINSTLTAISHMDKSKGGKGGLIVNMSSVLGLEPAAMISAYSASKHGVVGFTRSLANEFYYRINGVELILICPGLTKTALTDDFVGRDTFPYCSLMSAKLQHAKRQSAKECAVHTIKVMEAGRNGSIWISDLGELREVQPAKYWELS